MITMMQHPHADDLPAFVLNALDAEAARNLGAHVSICPSCRRAAAIYYAVVSLLPYTATQHDPPPHVKSRLMALIAARAGAPDSASDNNLGRTSMSEHAQKR